tara:strand:- start:25271 stop:25561 length:291 start_codon:yes stop_codon:yes gene_type:complete
MVVYAIVQRQWDMKAIFARVHAKIKIAPSLDMFLVKTAEFQREAHRQGVRAIVLGPTVELIARLEQRRLVLKTMSHRVIVAIMEEVQRVQNNLDLQ